MTHDTTGYASSEIELTSNRVELEGKISKGRFQTDLNIEMDKLNFDQIDSQLFFRRKEKIICCRFARIWLF